MDLLKVSTCEIQRKKGLDEASCSSFHPSEPLIYISLNDEIYMCDVTTGTITAQFRVNGGSVRGIYPCLSDPLLVALVHDDDNFFLYVWNTHTRVLKSVFPLKHMSSKKKLCAAISPREPKFFYSISSSKHSYAINLTDGSIKKYEVSKPIIAMNIHPFKPIMCCIHLDCTITLLNCISGNILNVWGDVPYVENVKDKENPYFISYHPTQPFLVVSSQDGRIACWNTTTKEFFGTTKVLGKDDLLKNAFFHPTLPFLITLSSNDTLNAWNFFPTKKKWIIGNGIISLEQAKIDLKLRNSKFTTKSHINSVSLSLDHMCMHPTYNYISFIFKNTGRTLLEGNTSDTFEHNIYSFSLHDININDIVVSSQLDFLAWFLPKLDEGNKYIYYFPNECCHYLDDNKILTYSPAYNDTSLAKKLPTEDFDKQYLKATRIIRNKGSDRFLVFFVRQSADSETNNYALAIVGRDQLTRDITVSPAAGNIGVFLSDEEFLVLSSCGKKVEIWKNEEDTTIPITYELPCAVEKVFWTPFGQPWFLDTQYWRIIPGCDNPIFGSSYSLNFAKFVQLQEGEIVKQVQWQYSVSQLVRPLAGVVTNKRLFIIDENLNIVSQSIESATSCLWLGATLLYTTTSHVKFLTTKGYTQSLLSLKIPGAFLVTILCDRIVFAVRRSGETTILNNALSLLEPLILGLFHYTDKYPIFKSEDIKEILNTLTSIYDSQRMTLNLIQELLMRKHYDIAIKLTMSNTLLHPMNSEIHSALNENNYKKAIEILNTITNCTYENEVDVETLQKTITPQKSQKLMKTLPLQTGTGNLIIGPLLTNKLLQDWFPRQIPYFEIPRSLSPEVKSSKLKSSSKDSYLVDVKERRGRRTQTVAGDHIPDPSLFASYSSKTKSIPKKK